MIDKDDRAWLIEIAGHYFSEYGGRHDVLRLERIQRAEAAYVLAEDQRREEVSAALRIPVGEPQSFRCYCWRAPEPHPEHIHRTDRHPDGRRLRESFPADLTPSLLYAVAVRINATFDLAKSALLPPRPSIEIGRQAPTPEQHWTQRVAEGATLQGGHLGNCDVLFGDGRPCSCGKPLPHNGPFDA